MCYYLAGQWHVTEMSNTDLHFEELVLSLVYWGLEELFFPNETGELHSFFCLLSLSSEERINQLVLS